MLGLLLAAATARAQDSPSEQPTDAQRVLITGSQLPQVDAETAVPVQVIGREEIERSGATSIEEVVRRISENFGNINQAHGIADSRTPGFSGVSLRGFGSLATLVLLNGRRITNYALSDESGIGVDLQAIPLAAIDRIEVLTDGASAIYGSEAIAGVVNFILRQEYRGGQVDVQHSWPQARGGGGSDRQTITAGAGALATDGFNLFGIIDHDREQHLPARDRPFSATSYRPDLGDIYATSIASFPANIALGHNNFINPAAPACTSDSVSFGEYCRYNLATQVDILPQIDNLSALARGTLALTSASEAYLEMLASRQETQYTIAASPVFGVVPVGSPFYPTGLNLDGDAIALSRTVPLGPRVNRADTQSWRALLGWRGVVAGWDVDTALMLSTTHSTDDLIHGYVDLAKYSEAVGSGLINPFGDSGPVGDATLASTEIRGAVREGRGTTQSVDFRASRDLAHWTIGIVSLGFGAEARHEKLTDELASVAQAAAGFGSGFTGTQQAGARDAQAVYVELALPIVQNLDAQLALRTDHYSDFGSHTSPKVAVRWQPSKAWMLRASAGTGFRAPSLPEIYALQTAPVMETGNGDSARCPVTQLVADCDVTVPILVGGNPALQPETSRQASLGLVLQPLTDASISLDWWHLTLSHRIGELGPEDLLGPDSPFGGAFITRGPTDPAFPQLPGPITGLTLINENLGEQRASGVDVDVRCAWSSATTGRFKLRLTGSYLASWQASFNGVEESSLAQLPRWQHTLSAGWDRGPWSSTLEQSWRAGYRDENLDVNGNPRHVAAYRLWNAETAYTGFADWSLAAGVKNLFDTNPPITNQQSAGVPGFDPRYADPRGRIWYLRATYGWN